MARRHGAADPIEELNTRVDQLAAWAVRHRLAVVVGVVAILAAAGSYGIYDSVTKRAERRASAALARVESEYRQAMGADPTGSGEIPEPANPELATRVRTEFGDRFRGVAEEHPGTRAAVLARLEAGNRLAELGEAAQALRDWDGALDATARRSPLRALVLLRIGRAHEQAQRFAQAAGSFEEAGRIKAFPLRYQALADAARNHANAGDASRAVALFERIESEAPDADIPDFVRSRLRELRRGQAEAPEADGGSEAPRGPGN